MAEDKKGFILYADQQELFSQLTDEQAGKLIKHIYSYVNDENPTCDDLVTRIAFAPIKQQLKRDLKKYERIKLKRSEAGKKSAEARANKKKQDVTNSTSVESVEQKFTNSTVKDNVNVTVNDNDNDNVNVNDNVKESVIINSREQIFNSTGWKEQLCMKKKLKRSELDELLNEFLDDQELKENLSRPINAVKSHFVDWLNKRNREKRKVPQKEKSDVDKLRERVNQNLQNLYNSNNDA